MKTSKDTPRTTKTLAIYDPKGVWFKTVEKAIIKHDNLLYEDEKNVQSFLRLMIKHTDVCMKAIAKSRFSIQPKD